MSERKRYILYDLTFGQMEKKKKPQAYGVTEQIVA